MSYLIQKYKTTAMQRILQNVSRDYHYFTSGQCPPEKIENMINKFDELYNIKWSKDQRYRNKKKGNANAQLIVYPHNEKPIFLWWLIATDGKGLIHEREHMHDVRERHKPRLKWSEQYQLIRMTKTGEIKPIWTWELTRKKKEEWKKRINIATKYKDKHKMRKLLFSLGRMPGFHGIRKTAFEFAQSYARAYDRVMNDKDDKKSLWSKIARQKNKNVPIRISYTRANPDDFIELSIVVKRMRKGQRPIPKSITKSE